MELEYKMNKLSLKKSDQKVIGQSGNNMNDSQFNDDDRDMIQCAQEEEERRKYNEEDREIDFELKRQEKTGDLNIDKKTIDNCVSKIEDLLRRRHYMATLSHNITAHEGSELPSFARIDIRFSPRYGSEEARDFIRAGLMDVEDKMKKQFKREISDLCDQFIKDTNSTINNLVNKTRAEIGYTTPNSGKSRLELTK